MDFKKHIGRYFYVGFIANRLAYNTGEAPRGEDFSERSERRGREALKKGKEVAEDVAQAASELPDKAAQAANEAMTSAGKKLESLWGAAKGAAKAAGEGVLYAQDYWVDKGGKAAQKAGEAVKGTLKDAGEAVLYAQDFYVDKAHKGAAYVERQAREAGKVALQTAKDSYELVAPGVETLVGLGIIGAKEAAKLATEVHEWNTAQVQKIIDAHVFVARYVKDGVVDTAKVAYEFCIKKPGEFLEKVAVDSYREAVATGKTIVRVGEKYYDIATEKGAQLAREATKAVGDAYDQGTARIARSDFSRGVLKAQDEYAIPAAETLIGLHIIVAKDVAKLGTEVAEWSGEQLAKVMKKAEFLANYVKDGVVDMAKVAYDFGVKKPAEFLGKVAADSYREAVATGKTIVQVGEKYYDIATQEGARIAREATKAAGDAYDRAVAAGNRGLDAAEAVAGRAAEKVKGKLREARAEGQAALGKSPESKALASSVNYANSKGIDEAGLAKMLRLSDLNDASQFKKTVEQFQRDHGLKDDGIIGKDTWQALTSNLTEETTPTPEIVSLKKKSKSTGG